MLIMKLGFLSLEPVSFNSSAWIRKYQNHEFNFSLKKHWINLRKLIKTIRLFQVEEVSFQTYKVTLLLIASLENLWTLMIQNNNHL